jgi:peptide deformylase
VAIRPVLHVPNRALKEHCRPVPEVAVDGTRELAADLVDTMRAHPRCVGLAAPQLGALVRMAVVDVTGHPRATSSNGLVVLVNPVLLDADGSDVGREGCLSVPEFTANVRRATRVVVDGLTPNGEGRRVEAEGFEARCLLHELDHLDGVLFLDRVASLATDVFRRRSFA